MIMLPDQLRDPSSDESSEPDLKALVDHFFGAESPLREAYKYGGRVYEERPQQAAMARAIAESFISGDHLCIEAPTGIGKSFAYLIPAIYRAMTTGTPVVISTHTIALQEQLLKKDIPVLQQLLDVPFSAALAKGRENYICNHRLQNALMHHQEYLPMDDLRPEVQKLADWAAKSKDGSRADLQFLPSQQTWAAVCSEPGVCPIEQGKADGHCFFQNARRRLFKAHIVVANHALLCVDLAMRRASNGEQKLLPDYGALIIDEAHTFEEVAATHLGLRLSTYGVMMLFDRLYRPKQQRGLLARDEAEQLRELAMEARDRSERFFGQLRDWVEQQHENPLTYSNPGHIPNQLGECWGRLIEGMKDLIRDLEGGDDDYRQELKSLINRLSLYRDTLDTFLRMSEADYVYWFELYGRASRHLSLSAVPIEVNHILRDELFSKDFPVVMTSATLAIKHDLRYFKQRVGADDARGDILDSPFNFRRQVELYVPYNSMPDPRDVEPFRDACCEQIRQFIMKTEGKAFVLFTSYSFMNDVAEKLEEFFALNRFTLMVQGRDLNRTQMLDNFREDTNSVIFGTDSFWMGVDVPGEALSNVIITKLPFPVPSHPVVAARSRRIEEKGGSSFRDYFLPEAILKFRQGVGRLIRSNDDHGIIVVLDPRIIRAGYGSAFLSSIPDCERRVF